MKNFIIATLMLSAFSVFAAPISDEVATLNRILMNNPEVVTKLSNANIMGLNDMTAKTIRPGVTKYVLRYGRHCHCLPANAIVTVLEDLTPTYADGPAVYQTKVDISEAQ